MASEQHSDNTRGPRRIKGGAAAPGLLQTQNLHSNSRFSYAETPEQIQPTVFQQFSSPTNSTIDESPIAFGPHQQNLRDVQEHQDRSSYLVEKQTPNRIHSPFSISTPIEPHPALSAPYEDAQTPMEPSAALPYPTNGRSTPVLAQQKSSDYQLSNTQSAIPIQGVDGDRKDGIRNTTLPERTLTYNPYSPAGPNVSSANHRPGQVAHPNSEIDPKWKHGMCEADSLCCIGLFCPCMVYGKTQYRLAQKAKKREATDLLGYESMNGACGLMAVACGFQWIFAAIQRTRIRKLYQITGSFASDCLSSFCCCCCVLMQNEREVRGREEMIRRYAGPASGMYNPTDPMTFAPPPR